MQSLNDLVNLIAPYFPQIAAFLAGAAAQKWFKLAEAILAILPKRTPAITLDDVRKLIQENKDGTK